MGQGIMDRPDLRSSSLDVETKTSFSPNSLGQELIDDLLHPFQTRCLLRECHIT